MSSVPSVSSLTLERQGKPFVWRVPLSQERAVGVLRVSPGKEQAVTARMPGGHPDYPAIIFHLELNIYSLKIKDDFFLSETYF